MLNTFFHDLQRILEGQVGVVIFQQAGVTVAQYCCKIRIAGLRAII